MATDQLSLYNDALRIIGERRLASLGETREPRYELDDVWALGSGAVAYCYEQIKPRFATVIDKITASTTDPETDLQYVFTLPTNYAAMVGAYSDAKLDEPLTRYLVRGNKLYCDQSPLYLRYVAADTALSVWSSSFTRYVGAYLARSICPRIRPQDVERVEAVYQAAMKATMEHDAWEEPKLRSKPRVRTLTTAWFQVYNDALYCMGVPQLISVNDDSDRRVALDNVLNQGAVEYLMENTQWHWSNTTRRIDYNPSLEPEWGYRYGFDKPSDLERVAGVFTDEYQQSPLRDYQDEGDYIFAEIQTIYLSYIVAPMLTDPTLWPAYFRKMLAGYLAKEAAPAIQGAIANLAEARYEERRRVAINNDAVSQPPRKIANSNWTRARTNFSTRRGRP